MYTLQVETANVRTLHHLLYAHVYNQHNHYSLRTRAHIKLIIVMLMTMVVLRRDGRNSGVIGNDRSEKVNRRTNWALYKTKGQI